MAFNNVYDVANRALQHLGMPRMTNFADQSKMATETGFIQDKVRRAELRRAVWTFATRRMVIRSTATNSTPISFAAWAVGTAYTPADIVRYTDGLLYIALQASTGVVPGLESYNPKWVTYFGQLSYMSHDTTVAYVPGDTVKVSTSIYLCVAANTNQVPPNATYWHVIQGATAGTFFQYAPDAYEKDGTTIRKKFWLPSNFMRLAAQDPKQPATAHLPVTAGLRWSDWELEDGYLYSATLASPTVIRFVADTADVSRMDDMFCEAWAARIAMNLCETFTQSKEDRDAIEKIYDGFVMTARSMSAIEAGSTEADYEQRAGIAPDQTQNR